MNKILENLKLSYIELTEKVTWPTWDALQESAIITLVASIIISLVIFGMDSLFENIFKVFYQLF